MSTMPIPRLPNPLTPKTIEGLMNARPYLDLNHPRSPLYRRLVQRGFEIMYPDTRFDAIGRMIDLPLRPPERIAHLVAEANREIEEQERGFDEKPSAGAGDTVHVQSHTRADGKVEVSDYWRSRPGEGSGSEPAPEAPKTRNLLDEAEGAGDKTNAGDTRAGTDDDRPKPVNPLPDLPEIEIRRDDEGRGHFGARRVRPDGTEYDHEGVDIKAPPGTPVKSPVDGTIDRITAAYTDPKFEGLQTVVIKGDDKQEYKFLYVTPKDGDGEILVKNKDRVSAGDPIGTVQDRAAYDRTGKMDNHIHIEIRDASKNIVDPTPHVKDWQK